LVAETLHLDLPDIAAHLAATDLFGLLDPVALYALAPLFQAARFGPGQIIARQGEVDVELWVVVDGRLSFDQREADGRLQHLGFRGYGAVIGEQGVFLCDPRTNGVMTIEPTILLHADGEELWTALRSDPALLDRLVFPDEFRERLAMQDTGAAVEGERTMAIFRRHWIALLAGMVRPVILFVVLLVLSLIVAGIAKSTVAVLAMAALTLGLPLLGAIYAFFDYWYDFMTVTNRRIIHVERKPMVQVHRREAPLSTIQDVQMISPGPVARLLHYGDIILQTAGTQGAMRFTRANQPVQVREAIFAQIHQIQEYDQQQRRAWIADQLRQTLGCPGASAASTRRVTTAEPPPVEEAGAAGLFAIPGRVFHFFMPKMRLQEGTVVTWRKHWWVLIRKTWLLTLIVLILAALLSGALASGSRPLLLGILGGFLLIAIFALWWRFEDWRNDLYQLTDDHILDIERQPLGFSENRRQAKLSQIQDIRYEIPNPIARILNYGTVDIETAAEYGSFVFRYVYRPASVQEEIFARLNLNRTRQQEAERARQTEEMKMWVTEYHRLVGDGEAGSPSPRP
jgi:CRP-like cAMP-binding protein/uncharacterized membrane protein YdbT with pleckstrin-like domain